MPQDTHIEMLGSEAERQPEPPKEAVPDLTALSEAAADLGRRLVWLPGPHSARFFAERHSALQKAIKPVLAPFEGGCQKNRSGMISLGLRQPPPGAFQPARAKEGFKLVRKLPHVRTPDGGVTPRVLALAAGFLAATGYEFSEHSLNGYVQAFQQSTVLNLHELWALVPALKLVLLEEIAARGSKVMSDPEGSYGVGVCVRSLREISQTGWKDVLEPFILFDRVLREDPAGAYPRMDFESRDLYRTELAKIAERSDLTESDIASTAVTLAQAAKSGQYSEPAPAGAPRTRGLLPGGRRTFRA